MSYRNIVVDRRGRVAVITLNRPQALNALNTELADELLQAARELDRDEQIGAIVLTGSDRAFAAGADIKEMAEQGFAQMYSSDFFWQWDELAKVRTPLVAAVAGHALGGGCELAMIADVLIAGENAKFGQPEIKLGVIPGMGGTQRLTRAIGKAKAMEMILTGRIMTAVQAESAGLVARVVPTEDLLEEAMSTATTIAAMSKPIAQLAKEAVNAAYETTLEQGIRFERRLNHASFATNDQTEGMAAFVAKRTPEFKHN